MRALLTLTWVVFAAGGANLDPSDLGRCGNGIVEPDRASTSESERS